MAIGDGIYIAVQFDRPLLGDPSENAGKFRVIFETYDKVPGGTLSEVTRSVKSVSVHPTAENTLLLELYEGNQESFQNACGDVTVFYMGGSLVGENGPVISFKKSFAPVDLQHKPNPHDMEHIEIVSTTVTGKLTEIFYSDYQSAGEHLAVAGASWTQSLTHVDYV